MPSHSASRSLRAATEDDIPALARLWAYAFPGERTAAQRARGLRDGGIYGGIEECRVVEESGRMAGALRTYRLRSWLNGRCHGVMGLAAVAVAPEFRRRGIGRWMCEEALRIGRERGDTFSYLFPFRVSFYRDLGYTLAGELHRYRFRPSDLPLFPGWDRVTRASGEELKEAREVYRRVAKRSNGLLERTARMWRFHREEKLTTILFRGEDGKPADRGARGYAIVEPVRRAAGGAGPNTDRRKPSGDWTLRVREFLAEDAEAYHALLGWISAQRDQWQEVVYDALPGERLGDLLPHPRRPGSGRARSLWFHSASILRGPMVRVLDEEKASRDLQTAGDAGDAGDDARIEHGLGSQEDAERGAAPTSGKSIERLTRRWLETFAGRVWEETDPDSARPLPPGAGEFRLLDTF